MHLSRHQIPPVHPNEPVRPGDGKRSAQGIIFQDMILSFSHEV
jgi:hypothetical protein